jgi:hypothetical protein
MSWTSVTFLAVGSSLFNKSLCIYRTAGFDHNKVNTPAQLTDVETHPLVYPWLNFFKPLRNDLTGSIHDLYPQGASIDKFGVQMHDQFPFNRIWCQQDGPDSLDTGSLWLHR